jgi:hypothetical protein
LIVDAVGGSADEHLQRIIDAIHEHRSILGLS